MKKTILHFALLFCSATAMAQARPDECLQKLRDICRKEQEAMKKALLEGRTWYMNYSLESKIFDPYKKIISPSNTNGEIVASKNIRYTKTPSVEVFLDENDVFTVDKQKKIVVHTSAPANALKFVNPYLDVLDDSTFRVYKMAGCLKIKDQNKMATRYDLVAIEKQKCPYTKVSFYIEDGAATFYKIYTDLNPAFSDQVRANTLVIKEQGYRKTNPDWYPIHKKVLLAGGKLKEPYSQYKYKDLITTNKIAPKTK